MIRKSRAIQALKISETLLMYEIHGKVHDQIQERPQTRKKQGNVLLGMAELCCTLYVPSEAPVICLILLFNFITVSFGTLLFGVNAFYSAPKFFYNCF